MITDETETHLAEHNKQLLHEGLKTFGNAIYAFWRDKKQPQSLEIPLSSSVYTTLERSDSQEEFDPAVLTLNFYDQKTPIGSMVIQERELMRATMPPVEQVSLLDANGSALCKFTLTGTDSNKDFTFEQNAPLDDSVTSLLTVTSNFIHEKIKAAREAKEKEISKSHENTYKPPKTRSEIMEKHDAAPETKFIDQTYRQLNPLEVRNILEDTPNIDRLLPFLPVEVQKIFGYSEPLATTEQPQPIDITPDDLVSLLNHLVGTAHSKIPEYFGNKTHLCMNLSVVITKYLHYLLGFPVVGLSKDINSEDKEYIRPVTALYNREPMFPDQIESGKFSMEDCVEVTIDGRTFLIDFNFLYGAIDRAQRLNNLVGTDNLGEDGLLIYEVTTVEQRKALAKSGIVTVDYPGFDESDLEAEESEWFNTKLNNHFLIVVGDPTAFEHFTDLTQDPRDYSDAQRFIASSSHLTVNDYIHHLSAAALISRKDTDHAVADLTGRGQMFLLGDDSNITTVKELSLLLDLIDTVDVADITSAD